MRIQRFKDATRFLEAASDWLLQSEAEHNVLLGIAAQLVQGNHSYESPIYLATVEDGRQVVGCAYRTPPWKLGLTRLPSQAIPLLVHDVAQVYRALPAVLGPEPEATQFAKAWTRQVGGAWSIGMRQRIHVLDEVVELNLAVEGALREADDSDRALIDEWSAAFIQDTGIGGVATDLAARLIRDRSLYLWEDDEPRSMVAAVGQTHDGVRVGYVYTPPRLRGRGYATAAVARLSELLLRSRKFCCLYTDLANPTSNAIYQRIGYRPLCDVVDVEFT